MDRPAPPSEAPDPDVLICGAGPTGLMLAIELIRRGVSVRVIDQGAAASVHSKALVIQPRTLEAFERIGVVDEVLEACQPVFTVKPYSGEHNLFTVRFREVDGPYARPVMLRQSRTEQILAARLSALGGGVERGMTLVSFAEDDAGITCEVRRGEGGSMETIRCRYLAGCDGAHSVVRHQLDIPFEGRSYPNDFIQADVKIDWEHPTDTGLGFLADDGAMVCLPLGEGVFRIIRIRHERPAGSPDEPTLEEFQAEVDRLVPMRARLYDPEWIVRFRLSERLAARYREGRAFLLGDAAHIHTPAGGQGMNTGIQDAENLGWKLALVLQAGAGPTLLDSYERERRPIAQDVLRFTDFAFRFALAKGAPLRKLMQRVAAQVLQTDHGQQALTRKVSQLDVHVRRGGLGVDHRGVFGRIAHGPHVGERAPDATVTLDGAVARLFSAIGGPGFSALVFDDGKGPARAAAERLAALGRSTASDRVGHSIAVAVLWVGKDPPPGARAVDDEEQQLHRRYLAQPGEIVLVRPDGFVALRAPHGDVARVIDWLAHSLCLPSEPAPLKAATAPGG